MTGRNQTRRRVMKGISGTAFTCLLCNTSAAEREDTESTLADATSVTSWKTLDAPGYPFTMRYQDGYLGDAKLVKQWATFAHDAVQKVLPHSLDNSITFDIFPAAAWDRSHDTMSYNHKDLSVSLVAPSDYAGTHTATKQIYYRHGIAHEYVHALQKDVLTFHTHAGWFTEGFAEAIAVYYTDDEIYEAYHNRRDAKQTREKIRDGYGFLLGVTEDKYRGAMHLLRFMFEKYGAESVLEVHAQDATNIVEAIEEGLGITMLDLQQEWLLYAQREIGGDYMGPIRRLGGKPEGFVELASDTPFSKGTILVKNVVYQGDDYVVVLLNEAQSVIGTSQMFTAGSVIRDTTISLDQSVSELEQVTARIHRATDTGYGAPVTVAGSEVTDTALYTTTPLAIGFATLPTDGDTTVQVRADVSENYNPVGTLAINVYQGAQVDSANRIGFDHNGVTPGQSLVSHTIQLDTESAAVPLEVGETVSVYLEDFGTGEEVASATVEVVSASASRTNSSLGVYAGSDRRIDTHELRTVVQDWVFGDVQTSLLRNAIQAWVTKNPV